MLLVLPLASLAAAAPPACIAEAPMLLVLQRRKQRRKQQSGAAASRRLQPSAAPAQVNACSLSVGCPPSPMKHLWGVCHAPKARMRDRR
jgi:hypothetical protein